MASRPAEKFVQLLQQSPEGGRIIELESRRQIQHRQELLDALAKLRSEEEKSFPERQENLATARQKVKAAEDALLRAQSELRGVIATNTASSAQYNFACNRIECELVEGANPAIAEFRDEMSAALDELPKQLVTLPRTHVNEITGSVVRFTVSNAKSIEARRRAILRALENAMDAQLDADQGAVLEKLARLREALPTVGGLEE